MADPGLLSPSFLRGDTCQGAACLSPTANCVRDSCKLFLLSVDRDSGLTQGAPWRTKEKQRPLGFERRASFPACLCAGHLRACFVGPAQQKTGPEPVGPPGELTSGELLCRLWLLSKLSVKVPPPSCTPHRSLSFVCSPSVGADGSWLWSLGPPPQHHRQLWNLRCSPM